MKIDVPYYSQFVDITHPFWMMRACGALSLQMVVEFYGKEFGDTISFCEEAKHSGGYHMENGWIHDYLVKKAGAYGLKAYRKEGLLDTEEICAALSLGRPVIVSVEKRVLEQKRFHMIVLVGYEDGVFWYHDSEATDKTKGKARSCGEATFLEYFRGKAIFVQLP